MKKQIITWGLMFAATLALSVSCAKEQDVLVKGEESLEPVGVPFELFAGVDTKTATSDGATFTWSENDALNVFYRAHGTTGDYSSNNEFTFSSGTSFTGNLATELTADAYDWWALYPYYEGTPSPENTTTGYTVIGGGTQNGNDSKAHLAGSTFPLYGKVLNVAKNEKPTLALKQAMSIIKVHVTNKADDPLTVNSVSVTAPEAISGKFYINFAGESPVFTPATGTNTTSTTATLMVNSGTAIAKNGTADFYVPIKPFTQATADKLTISINGYEKDVVIPASTEFKPGRIKTVNFEYDNTDISFVFNTAEGLTELGIDVPASASSGTDLSGPYVKNGVSLTFGKGSGSTSARAWKSSTALSLRTYVGNTLTFTAPTGYIISKIIFSSNTSYSAGTGTFEDNKWTGSASSVVLTRTGSGTHNSNSIAVTCEEQHNDPTISDANVTDAPARGGSALKDIVLTNFTSVPSLTATPDGTVVVSASVSSITTDGATVNYTLAPNYTNTVKEGSITIEDGASHSGTISISQLASVFSVSRTSIEVNANVGATTTFTVTSDFDWTIDDASLNGFTVSPNSFTYSGDQKQTVTITTTVQNATSSPVDLDIFCVTRTADNKDSDAITVSQKSGKLSAPVLTITPDAANNKFTVSWAAVSNASKYEYYVLDKDLNDKIATTLTADASTLTFDVTAINLGENYYVSVKAIGDNNPWLDSDEAEETVKVDAGSTKEDISGTFTYDSTNKILSLNTASGITIVQSKVSGKTDVNSDYKTATTLRVYVGHKLTFSGKTITKIEFTHTSSYKGSDGISANVGTYTQGDTSSTWTGEATSVEITNSGGSTTRQLRPTKITVYYK